MEFTFGKPYPRKPVIGDYFSQTESIVSEKIKNVLEPMNIKGIQLVPATVTSSKGDVYDGYYYIHLYNIIKWKTGGFNPAPARCGRHILPDAVRVTAADAGRADSVRMPALKQSWPEEVSSSHD